MNNYPNVAVERIHETIAEHKSKYAGQTLIGYDQVRLPPLMINQLEELLEVYHMYKGLCK